MFAHSFITTTIVQRISLVDLERSLVGHRRPVRPRHRDRREWEIGGDACDYANQDRPVAVQANDWAGDEVMVALVVMLKAGHVVMEQNEVMVSVVDCVLAAVIEPIALVVVASRNVA